MKELASRTCDKKKAAAHPQWVKQSQDFARQLAAQYENARAIGE
jgi:hypothetical protein